MKKTPEEKRAKRIINDGRFHLMKLLEDFPTAYPKIGVPIGKKNWEFFQEHSDLVKQIGVENNVSISPATDGSRYLYFEYMYIQKKEKEKE